MMARSFELSGPDAILMLALRLRARGKLVNAAICALQAANTFPSAFFEGHALAAAIAAEMGENAAAAEFWDKILVSAPQKLQWLEAAINFALSVPEAGKYLQKWQSLLANIYISTPAAALLARLQAAGYAQTGAAGIHAGKLMGWLCLREGSKIAVSGDFPKDFQFALQPRAKFGDCVLYDFQQELPTISRVARFNLQVGDIPLGGSPVICSPPQVVASVKKDRGGLTVLIPGYDDAAATLACIASVLASLRKNKIRARILVAWDNGPDQKLLARLRRLAERGKIQLLENPANLGFLANVNNALAQIACGDVILLNADTFVHGDWLDRLAVAARQPKAATITALGNEAELMSYPSAQDRGKISSLRQTAILDHAAAKLDPDAAVLEIPVGVGFCMLITRAVLNAIGALDGRNIFRGYSEEVDFCLRAAEAGFKNYGAFNVFVGHLGERSFGLGKKALAAQNNVAVFERFPDYRRAYERFLRYSQPLALRQGIARATYAQLPVLPVLEIRPWSLRFLPPWAKDEQCKPNAHGAALFLQTGPRPRAILRVWADLPVMETRYDLPAHASRLRDDLNNLQFRKILACALAPAQTELARQLGLDFQAALAPLPPPAWDGRGDNILAAPPQTLAGFRKLKALAQARPGAYFHVIHIDTLWAGAPRPGNVLELPNPGDYRVVRPDVFLLLDNFGDADAWRRWLDCHHAGKVPMRTGDL